MSDDQLLEPARYRQLAERYGTPLFVYNGDGITASLAELRWALPPTMHVYYSLKANPNISLSALLAMDGAGAEVSSLVELTTALRAGFPPEDIIFLGPGKIAQELLACVEAGIYAVVAESFAELAELDDIARQQGVRQRVLVRVNPAYEGKGSRLTMGGRPRQFGIDEEQLLSARSRLPDDHRFLDIIGVQAYLGTRILDADTVVDNTREVLALARRVAEATGIELRAVDVGGGLGVAYFPGERDPDLADLRAGLWSVVEEFRMGWPDVRLLFECGRFLTARAGTYLVRAQYVKESRGERFVITDGGTHHHMAAVGIGSFVKRHFPVRLLTAHGGREPSAVTITGPLCTPNDSIASNVDLPTPVPGDLIGILRSGAYGPTASPVLFLSHGYPAEVLVHGDVDQLVRSRDTAEDLLRKQHLFPFIQSPRRG